MTSMVSVIRHYQRNIEKYADDESRVLRYLDKLHHLGVTVQHLQETGVGRTVNALRKEPSPVGEAARALVSKWKTMVAEQEDSSDSDGHASDHRGRDSPEESDHTNPNQSRDGGQAYQSVPETDRHYNLPDDQINGNHNDTNIRHVKDYDDDARSTNNNLQNGDSEDEEEEDERKPDISQIKIKTECTNTFGNQRNDEENEYSSDNYTSDEKSHSFINVKEENKSDEEHDKKFSQSSKCSSNELSKKSKHRENNLKSENTTMNKTKTDHRSNDKDRKGSSSQKHSDKSRQEEKECKKEKSEPKHHSDKNSTFDKEKRSEKQSSSSDKHRSSDKHKKSSERDRSSSDKHKHSERSTSKDKHKSSSDKHRSSSHKESSREGESSSNRKEKNIETKSNHKETIKDSESRLSHKEKHSSSSKERSKGNESSSGHKDKHLKDESSSSKEKIRGESSSKSKHSEQSSSHSHKNKDEKKSYSDNKHTNSDKMQVEGEKKRGDKSSSSAGSKHKISCPSTSSNMNKDDVPKKKVKTRNDSVDSNTGISCESGASFAEALGMVSPVKAKKKSQTKDFSVLSPSNGSATPSTPTSNGLPVPASLLAPSTKLAPLPPLEISALPEISPHYKPRPPPRLLPGGASNEEQALTFVMSNKNQRTKVFSGNKTYGKMSSLYDLCVAVLQEHIDALEYTGGVPYEILKPVVDRATPEQLFVLEHYNPYLMDDTNHLWKLHCERKFRNKRRGEMETWREMYLRCQEEQEAKLKSLTANIKMAQEVRNAPTKQTKMAYVDSVVKPPRNIARKQAIHGTARAAVTSPAARVAALAGAGVVRAGTTPSRVAAAAGAPPAPSHASFKPKKAPLMQKALQFMRGRKR